MTAEMTAVPGTTVSEICYSCMRPTQFCVCEQARAGGWRDRAACRPDNRPPDVFTPPGWGEGSAGQIAIARSWCAACPVRDLCLAWAHCVGDDWSVLGGHTPAERRAARRAAGAPDVDTAKAGRVPAPCGTVAAARRHRRAGEQPCRACTAAVRDHSRQRRIREADQRVAS